MNQLFSEHFRRNADSRDSWKCFSEHRQRVTELLLSLESPSYERLCILGAGNCNDIDLRQLLQKYHEIHLVDIDETALLSGIQMQCGKMPGNITLHTGIDLTGIGQPLEAWKAGLSGGEAAFQELLSQAAVAPFDQLPKDCNVVASIGLLTQLFDCGVLSLGPNHERLAELLVCLRHRHLCLLAETLCSGGRAALVTDFVASTTLPDLPKVAAEQLANYLSAAIAAGNFFTGANPQAIHATLLHDAKLAPLFEQIRIHPPWRWNFGPRVYAVCAVEARRSSTPVA